jgi:hypothetical protein
MDTTNQDVRDQLIQAYNLQALSAQEQDETIAKIGELVFQNVLMRVIPTLAEDKQSAFEALLEGNASPEEIFGFLSQEVPDLETIMQEESANFHKESMDVMSKIG